MNNYKVLLVDDDEEIRSGVANFIRRCEKNLTLIAQAENGADGLDLAEMLRPDIVLTDIKMPYMDGLLFCKKLRRILPAAKLVIFSGFDKFEYAQKAIAMNVSRYILKPINGEELSGVLDEVCAEIEQERALQRDTASLKHQYEQSLPVLRETLLVRLLDGRISAQEANKYAINYELPLPKNGFFSVCLIKSKLLQGEKNEKLTLTSIKTFLLKHLELNSNSFFVAQYTDCIALIVHTEKSEQILEIASELTRVCTMSGSFMESPIISGVGRAYEGVENVKKSAKEAKSALCYRMLSGQNVVYIGDVEPKEDQLIAFDDSAETDLINRIKTGKESDLAEITNSLSQKLHSQAGDIMQCRLFFLEMVTCLLRFLRRCDVAPVMVFGEGFDGFVELTDFTSIDTAMQWYLSCTLKLQEYVQIQSTDAKQHKIQEAKDYIAKNYNDSMLDVDALCNLLSLSPAYFSTLFKKHTDMSFTAYVTNVRMDAAVQLLKTTDEKTYAIAEKVGYVDPNYFSYVFKKKFGMSPSKYRTSL